MTQAQGIYKTVAYKKQVSKGTPASGAGGQLLRRETATFNAPKDSFSSNEINSHQQHTGDTHGTRKPTGTLNGNISPGTYADFFAALFRKGFTAPASVTGLTLTIAADGSNWSVTRSAGDFMGAVKKFDVIRLSGANLDAANVGVNLLVLGVTTTVLTVTPINGKTLTAESSKASSSVTFPGKKSMVPLTGHTNDYFTIEERFGDIGKSRIWEDQQIAKADISLPATGNATVAFGLVGIDYKKSPTQSLTAPAAETTTPILNATNGVLFIGTSKTAIATSGSVSIDGQLAHGEPTIGSKTVTDITKGDLKVTGSYTSLYEDETSAFDDETVTSICFVLTENADDDADFMTIVLPAIKVMTDDIDDGKKQLIKTNNFTAQINGAGGTALATDKTTIVIQDSTLS